MPSKVFITGGTGFVGSAVIDELLSRDHVVNALSHKGDLDSRNGRVTPITGGLHDDAALDRGMAGCDAVIHIVGIIFEKPSKGVTFQRIHVEGTQHVVDAAKRNGIRRYVHMSALGTRANAASTYHQTKYAAEQYVRDSGLDWTIIRPAMIHGPRGEFMGQMANWARKKAPPFLFMPYFGRGFFGRGERALVQPVYVGDVARAFVDALEKPQTIREIYPIGGPDRMTWPELYRTASEIIVGKPRWTMPIPAWKAKLIAAITPGFLLPFNRDQVIMSQEDNTCDLSKLRDDFGWEPRPFREMLETYRERL